MKTYKTSEIAKIIGIHSNTVRLYEEWEFIPPPKRTEKGYRIFTDIHLEQIKFARLALKTEVLQNGLRTQAIEIIKISAKGNYKKALELAENYLRCINREKEKSEEAINIAKQWMLKKESPSSSLLYTRKQIIEELDITIDTLRNWERNHLLSEEKYKDGFRIYNEDDVQTIKVIRTLRIAGYSLTAILRMMNTIRYKNQKEIDLREIINTPEENEDIISVCDRLLTSLNELENNAKKMIEILKIK